MKRNLMLLGVALLAITCMGWAAPKASQDQPSAESQTWTGVVSDSSCGAKHSEASAEAAACASKCVAGGAKYVLVSQGKVYQLDAQDKFADYAGKSVKVTGTLKDDVITVSAVEPAQ